MKNITSKVISLVLMCLFFITLTGCENDKWIDELSDKLVFSFTEPCEKEVTVKEIFNKKNSYLDQKICIYFWFKESDYASTEDTTVDAVKLLFEGILDVKYLYNYSSPLIIATVPENKVSVKLIKRLNEFVFENDNLWNIEIIPLSKAATNQ